MNEQKKSSSEFVNIKPIFGKYIKYWYVFVISALLCVGIGVAYCKFVRPTFQILANILIKENEKSGISGTQAAMMKNMAFGSLLGGSTSINDELQLIGSYSNFREVGKKLALNEIYKIKQIPFDEERYHNSPIEIAPEKEIADTLSTVIAFTITTDKTGAGSAKAKIGRWKTIGKVSFQTLPATLHTSYGDFLINKTPYYLPNKKYGIKVLYYGYDLIAEQLQKCVTIELASKKANVINLSVAEPNLNKGKDILNVLIQTYNKRGIEQKNILASNTISFLNERIELISDELDNIEKEIEIYKKENNLTDIETEAKIILDKSGDFKERLIDTESQYTVIELVEKFLLEPGNRYSLVPLNIGLSDRTVLEGLQKYNEALLERMKLMKNTYTNNPTITIINEQIDAMRDNMLATIRSLKSGFSFAREDLKKQEDYFTSRIKGMPTQEREFINIKRQQTIKQELYLFLLQKREENDLTLSITTPNAQIVDAAYHKSEPVAPKPKIVILISLIISIILSLVYIYTSNNLIELLSNRKK